MAATQEAGFMHREGGSTAGNGSLDARSLTTQKALTRFGLR
jgi:hypothetical protein